MDSTKKILLSSEVVKKFEGSCSVHYAIARN